MSEIIFQPVGRRIEGEPGETLLEAAQRAGVMLSAVCGGIGICGDCRVRILSGTVSALNDTEADLLSNADLADGLRLACQVYPSPDDKDQFTTEDTERTEIFEGKKERKAGFSGTASVIVVDVPPESLSAVQRSQVEGQEQPLALDPAIQVHDITGRPPSIHDLRGDWERVDTPDEWQITAPVLADLPVILRQHNWRARFVTRLLEVVHILPPDGIPLGFAVDVGTTGLAAYLVDLTSGETLAVAGANNPQIAYGEDVMARLTLAVHDPSARLRLQAVIVEGLNDLLGEVCTQAGVSPSDVVEMVAVGNTAMHHLLLALPVDQLGSAPYVPAVSAALSTPARALGLNVAAGAHLYVPPNVAGFIGGDHVAMLLATNTPDQPGVTLSIDIGTNTELTLNAHGQMWSCSTASGPALEGAHIRDGMRAADGAIERLIWQGDRLNWLTINHAPPVGLCGSGIVDAVAVLRSANILSATGMMKRDHPGVRNEGYNPYYPIVSASESGNGREIAMSRNDVSEVQLAKGAIRAGIKLMTEKAGLSEQDIDRVIIAGAFGNYIDIDSAIIIGMYPPLPRERFLPVGNAAGMGAKRLLINRHERDRARAIVQRLHYVELTNHPDFADRFSQALRLLPDPWD